MTYTYRTPPRRSWPGVLLGAVAGLVIGVAGTLAVLVALLGYEPAGDTPAVPRAAESPAAPADPAPASLGPCEDLAGLPTLDITTISLCDDAGPADTILVSFSEECADGRDLYWNDRGWGYGDGQWQAHDRPDGQLVPPDDEMAACSP